MQARGQDNVSGTFILSVQGTQFTVSLEYKLGGKPGLTWTSSAPSSFIIQTVGDPYTEENTAYATIQVVDPRKSK